MFALSGRRPVWSGETKPFPGGGLGEECLPHRVESLFGAERLGPSLGEGWVRSVCLIGSNACLERSDLALPWGRVG